MKAMLVASLNNPFHSLGMRSRMYDSRSVVIACLHSSMPSPCTDEIVCTPLAATSESTVSWISAKASGVARERSSSFSMMVSMNLCWSALRSN